MKTIAMLLVALAALCADPHTPRNAAGFEALGKQVPNTLKT